jgi:hypothetical protein
MDDSTGSSSSSSEQYLAFEYADNRIKKITSGGIVEINPSYNSDDELTKFEILFGGALLAELQMSFNKDRQITEVKFYYDTTNSFKRANFHGIQSPLGRLLSTVSGNSEYMQRGSSNLVLGEIMTVTYSDKKLSKVEYKESDGTVYESYKYTCDKNNNPTKVEYFDETNTLISTDEYTYDGKNNPTNLLGSAQFAFIGSYAEENVKTSKEYSWIKDAVVNMSHNITYNSKDYATAVSASVMEGDYSKILIEAYTLKDN